VSRPTILVAASGYTYRPRAACNQGDRAQLDATVQDLRAAFPAHRIVAVANSLNDGCEADGVEMSYRLAQCLTGPSDSHHRLPQGFSRAVRAAWLLFNAQLYRRGLRRWCSSGTVGLLEQVSQADFVMFSGAGVFNDRFATSVGAVWGLLAHTARTLRRPVLATGQQVGPLDRRVSRVASRWALGPLDLLGTRDLSSLDVAQGLGIARSRLVFTGDAAWSLPSDPTEARALHRSGRLPARYVVAQARFGPATGFDQTDAPALAELFDAVAAAVDLPVVFVPMEYSTGGGDSACAELIARDMHCEARILDESMTPAAAKAVIAQAHVAIGISYHFCVFAVTANTPVVGIWRTPYMKHKLNGLAALKPRRMASLNGLRSEVIAAATSFVRGVDTAPTDGSDIDVQPVPMTSTLSRFLSSRVPAVLS